MLGSTSCVNRSSLAGRVWARRLTVRLLPAFPNAPPADTPAGIAAQHHSSRNKASRVQLLEAECLSL